MKKLTVALLLLTLAASAFAASIEVVPGADGDHLIMKNALLRLDIDPNDGAKVESFQFAAWGNQEIITQPKYMGLFADHFWQESWPGQMWAAKYAYKINSEGPDEVSATFTYLATDKGVPQVAGIRIEKTLTLREGSKVVRDAVVLTNTNTEGRDLGYWQQNVAWLGGEQRQNLYFRPSKRGVSVVSSEDQNPPDNGFIHNPAAGWMAGIDQKTKTGLVFLMDYNDLWFLYNCTGANTMEWQYEAVAIPPGKSWKTAVTMIPISGLDSLTFASEQLLMSTKMAEDKPAGKLNVAETFAATEAPLTSLDVTASLETLLTNQQAGEKKPQRLENLTTDPQSLSVSFPYDTTKREPAVLRLALSGQTAAGPLTANPELWYGGSMSSNTNMTDGGPFYAIPAPAKVRHLLKPDKIARIHAPVPQVLEIKGLLAPAYRLPLALDASLPGAEVTEGYMYNGVFGATLDYFPYDYDKLMSMDLVVLADVSRETLGDTAMEMLDDYVTHGGHLLVLGGPLAFGDGEYKGSLLESVLPVLSTGSFDLQPCPTPGPAFGSGLLAGVPAYDFTSDNWVHRVKVKPGATVLLSAGATPLIVQGTFGTGTTTCVLATPVGKEDWTTSRQWREASARLVK
jgi:uncharacterized membrane protein